MKPKPRSAMTFLMVPVATGPTFSQLLQDERSVREDGRTTRSVTTQRGETRRYHHRLRRHRADELEVVAVGVGEGGDPAVRCLVAEVVRLLHDGRSSGLESL